MEQSGSSCGSYPQGRRFKSFSRNHRLSQLRGISRKSLFRLGLFLKTNGVTWTFKMKVPRGRGDDWLLVVLGLKNNPFGHAKKIDGATKSIKVTSDSESNQLTLILPEATMSIVQRKKREPFWLYI